MAPPAAAELLIELPDLLGAQGFVLLPIQLQHGLRAGGYLMAHRDPFDRLLAVQAELTRLTLVSLDPALQAFPCELLWQRHQRRRETWGKCGTVLRAV